MYRIVLIWNKFNQKFKHYRKVIEQFPLDLVRSRDYEISSKARKKYSIKLAKSSIDLWAIFGLLIIELDKACCSLEDDSSANFDLRESCYVFLRGKRTEETKVKGMINFLRHAFCHPERYSGLRIDPFVVDTLDMSKKDFDESYQISMFNKNDNDPYIKIGGGKIYFNEIDRLIKQLK